MKKKDYKIQNLTSLSVCLITVYPPDRGKWDVLSWTGSFCSSSSSFGAF